MIQAEFYDWQRFGPPVQLPDGCSPALNQLLWWLSENFGMWTAGCRDPLATSDSGGPSTHRWAALDARYKPHQRTDVVNVVIPHVIAWSAEWGIQAIHDYRGQRIWRSGRTSNEADACTRWWRAQQPSSSGMGQVWGTWLHFEVHPRGWIDARPAEARGVPRFIHQR